MPTSEREWQWVTAPFVGELRFRHANIYDGTLETGEKVFVKTARGLRGDWAGWILARELGDPFDRFVHPMVRRRVVIDGEEHDAAVGPLLEGFVDSPPLDNFDPDDVLAAAILDAVVLNKERVRANWLAWPDEPFWRLQLIDFDDTHCFHVDPVGAGGDFWQGCVGRSIPNQIRENLRRVAMSELAELRTILTVEEVGALTDRMALMAVAGLVPPLPPQELEMPDYMRHEREMALALDIERFANDPVKLNDPTHRSWIAKFAPHLLERIDPNEGA